MRKDPVEQTNRTLIAFWDRACSVSGNGRASDERPAGACGILFPPGDRAPFPGDATKKDKVRYLRLVEPGATGPYNDPTFHSLEVLLWA